MEFPKEIKTYCPSCKKHQAHKLKAFKSSKARGLSLGTRKNIAKHKKGFGGKAKFIKPVKKTNKKAAFVAICNVCKKQHYFIISKRMKKVELTA